MTLLEAASPAIERVRQRLERRDAAVAWRPASTWVGPLVTLAVALVLEILRGRDIRLPDPAPILLLPVVASALLGGRRSGLVAAGIAAVACLIAFASPPFTAQPDNALRLLVILLVLPSVAASVGFVRDRLASGRDELVARRVFAARLGDFTAGLTGESAENVYVNLVERVPDLIPCDLVALTLADPRDGRHFVRAVHGADPALVGVEIMSGVGVAGQAIRDRKVIVAERLQPAATASSESVTASTVAGAPVIVDGRVMATLTFGRTADARPFSVLERESMDSVAGAAALILSNAQLRGELAESALRDPVTNLYNRTYLEAALDQLLALRRRMTPEDRRPMAVLLFDVDGFRRFNEEHGRADGDRVLQAISGVLRARFRTSDTLARIGGDGFFVVMDGATRTDATKAAAEVRERVRSLVLTTTRGEPVRTSVSAGCATFVDADPGAQAVIRTVEAALDTARWSGKDAVVSI